MMLHNENDNTIKIVGTLMSPEKPIVTYPCNSKTLNMWKVKITNVKKTCALEDIHSKMVCLKIDDNLGGKKIYVMPLLHQ